MSARLETLTTWIAVCDECPWRSPAAREVEADAIADRDRHNRYVHSEGNA